MLSDLSILRKIQADNGLGGLDVNGFLTEALREQARKYAAAENTHAAAVERMNAASAELDAAKVRDRELHERAAAAASKAMEVKRSALETVMDGGDLDTTEYRRRQDSAELAATAIETMVFRVRAAERAWLCANLDSLLSEADLVGEDYSLRCLYRCTISAPLLRLEGVDVAISGGTTEQLPQRVVELREEATKTIQAIDEHDRTTRGLQEAYTGRHQR